MNYISMSNFPDKRLEKRGKSYYFRYNPTGIALLIAIFHQPPVRLEDTGF